MKIHVLFWSMISILVFLLPAKSQAQVDTTLLPVDALEALEDFFQNTNGEGSFDFNTIFEQLSFYLERPLDLNQASEEDLRELGLLTDVQILNFLRYRQQTGDFIAIYELQAIPAFSMNTVRRILPFVSVRGNLDDFQLDLKEMLQQGRNEMFVRWGRVLENQRGYEAATETSNNRYEGSPDQLYLRYRHTYYNKMSYGVTLEKDRGEALFSGSNPGGFDFYSAHFYLRDYRTWLKAVAIGDYNISFGQGLILFSGFGYGKSAQTTNLKRTGRTILPYGSVNEALFMRGAAIELAPAKNWTVSAFGSSRKRDGNLIQAQDTLENEDAIQSSISSFNDFGFHRTPSEIEDEDAITQTTIGGNIKYKVRDNHIALNVLYDQLDKPLIRRAQPYNRFYFNGDRLLNVSVDYSFLYRNLNFFGETARSDNGGLATINGVLIGIDRRADLAVMYRSFQRDFQALNANPVAETSGGRNEEGLYLGLLLRPAPRWELAAYYDQFRFPWLRFQVDAPSQGKEYRLRLTYEERRRLRVFAEIRQETKDINAPDNETRFNYIIPRTLLQTRLHIGNQISPTVELRTRVDWGYVEDEVEGRRQGVVLLQDILFRPKSFPLSFTARYALFDTHSYAIRFYHFENNLLNTFLVPAYYNRGARFYLNLRYRPIRQLTLEARIAQTYWADRDQIGSGLEAIDGPVRTQVSAQVKYVF